MSVVNVLHLSDLHFGAEGAKEGNISSAHQRRELIMNGLVDELKNQTEWVPHIVVLTGDIAWSAKLSDYDSARDWLNRLLSALNLTPRDVVACPGNHDIDREEAKFLRCIVTHNDAKDYLAIEQLHRRLPSFQQYVEFAKKLGLVPLENSAKEKADDLAYLYGTRTHKGLRFISYNSAWACCGKDDQGKLWIGMPLVEDMLNTLTNSHREITISLFHHPFSWTHTAEQCVYELDPAIKNDIINMSDFILNGHVHGEIKKADHLEDKAYQLITGAVYEKKSYRMGCQILKIDTGTFTFSTNVLKYDNANRKWIRDYDQEYLNTSFRTNAPRLTSISIFRSRGR